MSKATTLANMCVGLLRVKEITINNLNLPVCTAITTMFRHCYNLKKITFKNWSMPSLSTAPAQILGDCWSLRDVDTNVTIPLNHSYNTSLALTHDSLLNILNALPTVSTARTLSLST